MKIDLNGVLGELKMSMWKQFVGVKGFFLLVCDTKLFSAKIPAAYIQRNCSIDATGTALPTWNWDKYDSTSVCVSSE